MKRLMNLSLSILAVMLAAAPVLAEQPNVTVFANPDRQWGTHPESGHMMFFSPNPPQLGQSFIHWDNSAEPNLLMEPFISPEPNLGLDITPSVLQDLGWSPGHLVFNVIPGDPPGVGFNDATPFAGAPGNPATTLGEARMNLLNFALASWANTLHSDVPVDLVVIWAALPCTFGQRTIGRPTTGFVDSSFPQPGVVYPSALAEAFAGEDLSGPPALVNGELVGGDILLVLNSVGDTGCFPGAVGYYYGLDENVPSDRMFLAGLIRRSVAHGLGFFNLLDFESGEFQSILPSIFDTFLFDETVGKTWSQMTNAERLASSRRFRELTFNGPLAAQATADFMLPGMEELNVNSPPSIAGRYEVGFAPGFGRHPDAQGITADLVCMKDFINPVTDDLSHLNGCTPATNPEELAGKIALIDRGGCTFVTKLMNAEAAGAVAAIVINNEGTTSLNLGGSSPTPIGIPMNSVGNDVGRMLRQAACPETGGTAQGGRFQASALWATPDGKVGEARATQLTDDAIWFYFFNQGNVELVVKVLNGCAFNDHFWVFAAGLTDVQVLLSVTDTATGTVQVYVNPLGMPFQPILDTGAFATCP